MVALNPTLLLKNRPGLSAKAIEGRGEGEEVHLLHQATRTRSTLVYSGRSAAGGVDHADPWRPTEFARISHEAVRSRLVHLWCTGGDSAWVDGRSPAHR